MSLRDFHRDGKEEEIEEGIMPHPGEGSQIGDLKLEIAELREALAGVTRILRAVRYQVGLGKNQLGRLERAEKLLAEGEG